MSLATEMDADVDAIKDDIGVSVTFGAVTRTCLLNRQSKELDMGDAGYLSNFDLELVSVISDWTTAPAVNDKVTVASVSYRVLRREDSANGILTTYGLSKVN